MDLSNILIIDDEKEEKRTQRLVTYALTILSLHLVVTEVYDKYSKRLEIHRINKTRKLYKNKTIKYYIFLSRDSTDHKYCIDEYYIDEDYKLLMHECTANIGYKIRTGKDKKLDNLLQEKELLDFAENTLVSETCEEGRSLGISEYSDLINLLIRLPLK